MPPKIAALLCVGFILVIYIFDLKRKPQISYYHWVPFIWFLIVSSRPVIQWLNLSTSGMLTESSDIGSSKVDSVVLSILIILGFLILSQRASAAKQVLKDNKWLVCLVLYCLLSIFWSDYPSLSFKRWFRGFGTIVMVFVVLTENNPMETVKTMFRRCAFLWVPLSILFIKYFREIGVYYESWGARGYCGVTTGKNPLGRLCLILGTYFFWEIYTNWKNKENRDQSIYINEMLVNLLFFSMTIWLLLLADSATSLGCLLIGIFMFFLLSNPRFRLNLNRVIIFTVIFIAILHMLDLTTALGGIFFKILNRDPTLTGRTNIWVAVLRFVDDPLIGVGYDSFWYGSRLEKLWLEIDDGKFIQAHNGYLDVYLQIGLIGLYLLGCVLLSTYKNAKNSLASDYNLACFKIVFLMQYLFYNIAEASFKLQSFYWFVFLLLELSRNNNSATKAER